MDANLLLRKLRALVRLWRDPKTAAFLAAMLAGGGLAHAAIPGLDNIDAPGRTLPPRGAVPNPGTQQQEMVNITAPADWNVFEFVVTCGACHAGTADQHTAHFGNWAGGNMASAARDPVFRANQIGVNNTVKAVGNILGAGDALDGAGNVCFRCHSPNGWLSGRFDPTLGGRPDGSNMIQSILLSTDAEGVQCETCHKAVGAVTYQRPDVAINQTTGVLDKVWNLLAGLFDWEHQGKGFTDQAGDTTVKPGMPFGDTSLRYIEGLTEIGTYSGTTDVYFSDLPTAGGYTGQIYGIYPPNWPAAWKNPVPAGQPATNSAGQEIAYNKDGTLPPVFEVPVGTPVDASGNYDYQAQGMAIEHPTVGSGGRVGALQSVGLFPKLPEGPGSTATTKMPGANEFIRTSEFCGSCHDLTVPILNHGMPEQRTYSEWKFSDYSKTTNVGYDPIKKQAWSGQQRCQDCHMPKLKHEYSDADKGTYNADPWLVGGFPYGKDRSLNGGTAIHKLTGANRDLPDMMKALYPEVDLEVIGIPAGRDPRVFPGMLSDRGPMWDRAKHNTEITLRDGVDMKIVKAPTEVVGQPGVFEMQVQVTNKTGHRLPTGYPDGRRIWLAVNVKDASTGATVYESGVYDAAQATLSTAAGVPFKRAQSNVIDATTGTNAVMVYERVTGTCTGTNGTAALGGIIFPDPAAGVPDKCSATPALTNNFILFDNRIPPKGFTYADYRQSGIKFWNYDPATMVPYEEGNPATPAVAQRYPDGQGYDLVTYRFAAPSGAALTAAVDLQWQTHTREFMEHLRDQDSSAVRPQGPPNPADPMYPAAPNYLSNSINGKPLSAIADPFKPGVPLNDNWGGVAYAAWLETGMGAPFRVARDDSSVTAVPAAPTNVAVAKSGEIDPVTMVPDMFSAIISWDPVAGADGYEVWVLYGKPDPANPTAPTATADWDRLAVVDGNTTSMIERVLNPGNTYGFKVVAFNGKGPGADSNVASYTVGSALPKAPSALMASNAAPGSTATSVTLTWMDNATNEAFFEVWRYPTMSNGMGAGQAVVFTRILSQTAGPVGNLPVTGTNTWVDTDPGLVPGVCYYYQVRSVTDAADVSTWTTPLVQGCTLPAAPMVNLSAVASGGYRVDVTWTTNVATATGYQVWRNGVQLATVTAKNYVDSTVVPATNYSYTVKAVDGAGTVLAEATVAAATPAVPVTPTNVVAAATGAQVNVTWVHNGANADGFAVERSTVTNGTNSGYIPVPIAGIIVPANAPTFNDLGVAELTTYQYRVKAVRQVAGDSPYAVSNTVTTGLFGPANLKAAVVTPTGPFLTGAYGNPSLSLNWVDTSSAETGFEIQYCTASCTAANAKWIAGGLIGANAGTGAVANLFTAIPSSTGARTVGIRVRAVSGAVTSAWAMATGIAVPARPSMPSLGTPAQVFNTTDVKLTWSNVSNETGYLVERSADNGATWGTIGNTAVNVVTYTDTTATGGATFLYRVTALGNGGSATSANKSRTVVAAPAQPVIVSAVGSTNGTSVALTWDAAAGATNYAVQYKLSTATAWSTPINTTGTSRTITGLAAGNTYSFQVGSTNAAWTAPNYSAPQDVTLVPPAPGTPSVTNTGTCAAGATNCTQSVTVTVSALATNWEVQVCTGATTGPCAAAGAGWTTLASGTATGTQTVTSGGLARGTAYLYRARAGNAGGNSLWSGVRSVTR